MSKYLKAKENVKKIIRNYIIFELFLLSLSLILVIFFIISLSLALTVFFLSIFIGLFLCYLYYMKQRNRAMRGAPKLKKPIKKK